MAANPRVVLAGPESGDVAAGRVENRLSGFLVSSVKSCVLREAGWRGTCQGVGQADEGEEGERGAHLGKAGLLERRAEVSSKVTKRRKTALVR